MSDFEVFAIAWLAGIAGAATLSMISSAWMWWRMSKTPVERPRTTDKLVRGLAPLSNSRKGWRYPMDRRDG